MYKGRGNTFPTLNHQNEDVSSGGRDWASTTWVGPEIHSFSLQKLSHHTQRPYSTQLSQLTINWAPKLSKVTNTHTRTNLGPHNGRAYLGDARLTLVTSIHHGLKSRVNATVGGRPKWISE